MNKMIWGCLLCLLLVACNDEDNKVTVFPGKTLLVYMVAENTLTNYAEINLDSIARGLQNSDVGSNVLVYVDTRNSSPELIRLTKQNKDKITRSIIKTYPEQNSVSPTVMTSVLKDMTQSLPSQSYGLILWSHGYSWIPANSNTKATTRWFGQDGIYFMDIPDLVTALNNSGTHFSYIMFDACFMASVETSYALRTCTDYIIASAAEVLAAGFPYQSIVPHLLGNAESDYIKVASLFYEFYQNQEEAKRSATIACIKCSELENLATQMKSIVSNHATELASFNATNVQYLEAYDPHLFYDLESYVKNFATTDEQVAFDEQLNKTVIYKEHTAKVLSATSWGAKYIPIKTFSGFNTYILCNSSSQSVGVSYKETCWYADVFKEAFDMRF